MGSYKREDLAWAAGLFEGEGCFSYSEVGKGRGSLHATVKMTDRDVIYRFQDVIGLGEITLCRPQRVGWKVQWNWQVGSFEHFQAVVALLWPWLCSRRRGKAKQILKWYHELEPPSFRLGLTRVAGIKKALAETAVWGTRWKPGRTQLEIAREFGVSPGYITAIKKRM
jgi:hypothetical protein